MDGRLAVRWTLPAVLLVVIAILLLARTPSPTTLPARVKRHAQPLAQARVTPPTLVKRGARSAPGTP